MKNIFKYILIVVAVLFLNINNSFCQTNIVNLLDNAKYNVGFESGSIAPWANWGGLTISTDVAHSGKTSMFINAAGAGGQGGGFIHISGLTGGTAYTMSAWIKGPGAQVACATYKNDTIEEAAWLVNADDTTATNDWEQKYYSVDPLPADCNAINIIIWAKGNVYVDDIGLVEGYDPLVFNTTAVKSITSDLFKIYPNHVTNVLNISLTNPNSKVSIFNSLGEKITESIVKATTAKFDVSNYTSGLYFVSVNNGQAQKFVK